MRQEGKQSMPLKVRTLWSYKEVKPDRQDLLQKFLSHVHTNQQNRNLKWVGIVKRDIETLCETAAIFNPGKQWQEYPLVAAPNLRKRLRKGRLVIPIRRPQLLKWMTQLKEALEQLYPRQFPTPEPISVAYWPLPVSLEGVLLQGGVAERRKLQKITNKVIEKRVFVHIRTCYVVDWPHLFWFAMADLLEEFASALRRCIECQNLFLKTKRQEYCSSACRINRWRRENPIRSYEIRRKAYVRSVHEKRPGAPIVQRGPRTKNSPQGG